MAKKTGAGGKPQEYDEIDGEYSSDGAGGTHKATPAEEKRLKELGFNASSSLSKQEWAMFYERIGKIKKEWHYVAKTANGEMIIPIETKDSNVLVIALGSYEKPIVKFVFRFKNSEYMYRMIEKSEEI